MSKKSISGLVALAVIAGLVLAVEGDPPVSNLITHSEVWIDAPAEAIWPYILDTSEWKTLAKSSHYSGEPGAKGEVQLVTGGTGTEAYNFFIETVAIEANRHKVIKIYPEDRSHFGFSAWRLFEIGSRTLVTYDVYSEFRLPGATPDQAAAAEAQGYELNKPRFDRELELLKTIVEAKGSA